MRARSVEPSDQSADFLVGLAGDASSVEGADFIGRPADGARAKLDRPRPEALADPQVQRGARIARLRFDVAAAEDRGGVEGMSVHG